MKKYEYVSINIAKKAMPKIYFGAKSASLSRESAIAEVKKAVNILEKKPKLHKKPLFLIQSTSITMANTIPSAIAPIAP